MIFFVQIPYEYGQPAPLLLPDRPPPELLPGGVASLATTFGHEGTSSVPMDRLEAIVPRPSRWGLYDEYEGHAAVEDRRPLLAVADLKERAIVTDAKRDAPVRGRDVGYASLVFWKRVPLAERSFETAAPSERCSSPALKRVLDPTLVSDEELAKVRQTMDPRVKAEFKMYERWRTILDDQRWIVAPCNTLWPN